jgi:predicted small metal-binding protein
MTYSADLSQVCGCGMTMQGASKEELTGKVVKHASDAHGMKSVPPEIADKLNMAIRQM